MDDDIRKETDMPQFQIDRTKPTLPETGERSDRFGVAPILDGAAEICSSRGDEDSEIWHLTSAGQFVRQTGVDEDRFYVVPAPEALEFLQDFADDDVMEDLRSAGAFDGVATGPSA